MSENKRFTLFVAFLFINGAIFSQYNANSIYSRFGVGDIDQTGFVQNRALGGLSVCLRQKNQINYLNPASYDSQDTMSFIWDIGMFGNFNTASTSQGSSSRHGVNFDHLALSFPVSKWDFMSAGLTPFTITGYNLISQLPESFGEVDDSYIGSGNLNKFFIGDGFGLFKKQLNFGFNVSYIFGSLNRNESIEYYDSTAYGEIVPTSLHVNTYWERKYIVNGLNFNFGLQYVKEFSQGTKLIGGITYEPKSKLSLNYINFRYRVPYGLNDTLPGYKDTTSNFYMPARLGIGVSIIIKDKLMIGLDYTSQDWSKSSFPEENDTFKVNHRISFGMQYTPNRESYRSYYEKIDYRLGGYYNDTYLILNGQPIKDYGITFGLGLPFRNTSTKFNIACEIGSHGETSNNLVKINYTRITLSLTLYDFWFIKKKYD
jgi:hypothetical protein